MTADRERVIAAALDDAAQLGHDDRPSQAAKIVEALERFGYRVEVVS